MKIISTIVLSMAFLHMQAQDNLPPAQDNVQQARDNAPKGFRKGMVVLEDSTVQSGYIRENFRGDASLIFIAEKSEKKQHLDGSQVRSVSIGDVRFICFKGDFFRVISEGDLYFLQKSSDASGKPVYNGTEAMLINGTDGRPGDYFVYDAKQQLLDWVTRKTLGKVITETFAGCTAAIDKAKAMQGDMSGLKEAVDLYNSRNK